MKKKIMSALLASVLCVSMVLPAAASAIDQEEGVHTYKTGTDVYAGVTLDNENPDIGGDPRIRVTVPTMFAFVVNGTRLTNCASDPLTVNETRDADGKIIKGRSILLPNFTVSVDTSAPGTDNTRPYSLDVTGDGKMQFNNYSTRAAVSEVFYNGLSATQKALYPYDMSTETNRVGIEVDIIGYIENEGTLKSRNYWEHVPVIEQEPAAKNAGKNQFKKFTLSVNEIRFDNTVVTPIPFSDIEVDRFYMANKIKLYAPRADLKDSCDETSNFFAKSPATQDINFSVDVGGVRGDYKQIEQSAKIGTIVWTASYTYKNDGTDGKPVVPTAPDNDYQDNVGFVPKVS